MSDVPPETRALLGEPYITAEEVVEIAGVKAWRIESYPPVPKTSVGGRPRYRRADAEVWRAWEAYKETLVRRSTAADRLGIPREVFYRMLGTRRYGYYGELSRFWKRALPAVPVMDSDMVDPDLLAEWEAIADAVRAEVERQRLRAEKEAERAARRAAAERGGN